MKQYIFGLLLMGLVGLHAQTLTVTDKISQQPIEGVEIISTSPSIVLQTDNKGEADITALKDAKGITLQRMGYESTYMSYEEMKFRSFRIELVPSNEIMDEVIISVNKFEQKTETTPMQITVIRRETQQLYNPQTAADLLGASGKVYIQKSQQGGGSPMIRGFATNRLLYSVDGVRMNTAIFRAGNIQNVISLDPFAIEQTEVAFGPGSVTYGSDAIGGVMSFTTLKPEFSLTDKPLYKGSALSRFSSANNEKTFHFDLTIAEKKWSVLTSISHNDFDDLRMGQHGPDDYLKPYYIQRVDSQDVVFTNEDPLVQNPSGYEQTNIMQKVSLKPNNNWNITYGLHYSETSEYGRYDRHLRFKNGLPRYAKWSYGPQIWRMQNLSISHYKSNKLYDQMKLIGAMQYFEESRISRSLNKDIESTQTEQVKAYSMNLDFKKLWNEKNQLFYGAEYVTNDVTSTGVDLDITDLSTETSASRYPQSTWSTYGIYLKNETSLSDKLLLATGVRYSVFNIEAQFDTTFFPFPFTEASLNKGAANGSVGLVYKTDKQLILKTNLSSGFRAPNIDDMGKIFDSAPGVVVVPNPDLKAETAYNIDLGVAKNFKDKITVDATGFYTLLQDAIVRNNFQLNGQDSIIYDGELSQVQALQNASKAIVYGLQLGMNAKLSEHFTFGIIGNYQKGEEILEDGSTNPLRHAAPLFGTAKLNYRNNKVEFSVYTNYQDEMSAADMPDSEKDKTEIYALDENGDTYAPAWYTLNFKAKYHITELINISCGLENITDQRYKPYSSGLAGAGRNFIFSFRTRF